MERFAGLTPGAIHRSFLAALKEGRREQLRGMILGMFRRVMKKLGKDRLPDSLPALWDQLIPMHKSMLYYGHPREPSKLSQLDLERYFSFLETSHWLEKYAVWVTSLWRDALESELRGGRPGIRIPEDLVTLAKGLEAFHEKGGVLPPYKRDLNQYKTFGDFWEAVGPLVTQKSKSELKQEGAEVLLDEGGWKVVKITNEEAASSWCRFVDDDAEVKQETAWCVKDPQWASGYLEDGPLYLIYKDGQKYALAHFQSMEFLDIRNKAFSDPSTQIIPVLDMIWDLEEDSLRDTIDCEDLYLAITDRHWPRLEESYLGCGTAGDFLILVEQKLDWDPEFDLYPKDADWVLRDLFSKALDDIPNYSQGIPRTLDAIHSMAKISKKRGFQEQLKDSFAGALEGLIGEGVLDYYEEWGSYWLKQISTVLETWRQVLPNGEGLDDLETRLLDGFDSAKWHGDQEEASKWKSAIQAYEAGVKDKFNRRVELIKK